MASQWTACASQVSLMKPYMVKAVVCSCVVIVFVGHAVVTRDATVTTSSASSKCWHGLTHIKSRVNKNTLNSLWWTLSLRILLFATGRLNAVQDSSDYTHTHTHLFLIPWTSLALSMLGSLWSFVSSRLTCPSTVLPVFWPLDCLWLLLAVFLTLLCLPGYWPVCLLPALIQYFSCYDLDCCFAYASACISLFINPCLPVYCPPSPHHRLTKWRTAWPVLTLWDPCLRVKTCF